MSKRKQFVDEKELLSQEEDLRLGKIVEPLNVIPLVLPQEEKVLVVQRKRKAVAPLEILVFPRW